MNAFQHITEQSELAQNSALICSWSSQHLMSSSFSIQIQNAEKHWHVMRLENSLRGLVFVCTVEPLAATTSPQQPVFQNTNLKPLVSNTANTFRATNLNEDWIITSRDGNFSMRSTRFFSQNCFYMNNAFKTGTKFNLFSHLMLMRQNFDPLWSEALVSDHLL